MGNGKSGLHGSKKLQQEKEIVWLCLVREGHCKTNKLNSFRTETMLANKIFFRCAFGLGSATQHFCLALSVGTLVLQWEQRGKEAGWCLDSNTHQPHKTSSYRRYCNQMDKTGGQQDDGVSGLLCFHPPKWICDLVGDEMKKARS